MLPRKWFYNLMYWRKPPWDTGISPPELLDFIAHHPPGRGLDMGCGTGTNAITLAQHGWEMIGIDFVSRAIATARKKASRANVKVEFQVGDVTLTEHLQAPFNLVLDIGCYHSLPPPARQLYCRNLDHLLAVGGTFLLYGLLKSPELPANRGLDDLDITMFSQYLQSVSHDEGLDRNRRSAWFSFTKPLHG